MPRAVGIMSWGDMNWLFPDFEETGLLYHGTSLELLARIFGEGLRPGAPKHNHETIYRALGRHKPPSVPGWVDPTNCVYGYMNKAVYPVSRRGAVIGIRAVPSVRDRTWVGPTNISDWLYCPREAGYFDFPARSAYYRQVVEPVCAETYWKLSLSFEEGLKIRHDQLLPLQGHTELLICLVPVPPELLCLAALGVPGRPPILRDTQPALFEAAEQELRSGGDPVEQWCAIEERANATP